MARRKKTDCERPSRPERAPYDKILIVCEGEKTEPNYLQELKDHYELSSANIEILRDGPSDPLGVFRHAKKHYKRANRTGKENSFDKVYCVFDKDNHTTYDSAIGAIRNAKPQNTYFVINSVPCFEYWLLLHYQYTTQPYSYLPGNSACNQLIANLKAHIPNYEKGHTGIFNHLLHNLKIAKQNAEHALQAAKASNTDNPSTRVHELVDYLQNIKTP